MVLRRNHKVAATCHSGVQVAAGCSGQRAAAQGSGGGAAAAREAQPAPGAEPPAVRLLNAGITCAHACPCASSVIGVVV